MKLVRKLREAFEEAKKRDRSFERALHFRAAMFKLEEELFEALASKESEERLPCGHPVTDDYAHNDPSPGATHFCVSCEKESEE